MAACPPLWRDQLTELAAVCPLCCISPGVEVLQVVALLMAGAAILNSACGASISS